MNVEQLLQTLRDGGLDDESIKALLQEALASLDGSPEGVCDEECEKEKASQLLGVAL